MTKRTPFRFKADIGPQRLVVEDMSAMNGATRNARASMESVVNQLRSFVKSIEDITPEALVEAMGAIKEKADYYCPVNTGELKASGYLEITSYGIQPQVEIGYGRGGEPDYAPIVHEDMQATHKSPTRAKWLESAINEHIDDIPIAVGAIIKRDMGIA